ncbi:MAG: hypothetical protein ACE5GC_09570, partial [Acidimicrobiia bacterium]
FHAVGGLLAGTVLALAGIALGGDDGTVPAPIAATTAPTVPVTPSVPVTPAGIVGNTRVAPIALGDDDTGLLFEFEVEALGGSEPVIMPDRWEVESGDGERFEATMRRIDARRVRFETPDGFAPQRLWVTGWRVQTPAVYSISLEVDGTPVTLADGTVIWVRRTIAQASGTIVSFGVDLPDDTRFSVTQLRPGQRTPEGPFVTGSHGAWLGSAFLPATFGAPQLTYLGDELPEVLELHVESLRWSAVTGRVAIPLPGEAR